MASLRSVKPCTRIFPGHLTSRNENRQIKPKRLKSDKDTVKKVFTVRRNSAGSKDSLPFLRKSHRATFEIQVGNVQLSNSCLKYIENQLGKRFEVAVSWKFFDYDKNTTPPEVCKGTKVNFDTVFNYKVDVTDEFVDFLKHKKITLELFASTKEKQICLGKGRTSFEVLINNPEAEQRSAVEMYDYYKARQGGHRPKPSARLEIFFSLMCDYDVFNKMARKASIEPEHRTGKESVTQDLVNIRSLFEIGSHQNKESTAEMGSNVVMPTDSELNNFEEALDLVLTRNKALRTTQSEISTELKERSQWLREEADWRRTLQEHAILSGKSPYDIKWRQWRDEFTANVSIRTYLDYPPTYKPELTITVVKMMLFDESPPMMNENITQFYIEYSFLGREGMEMETPESLPKSSNGYEYEFLKRFPINLVMNYDTCTQLADFIKQGDNLVFNIISEPQEDESVPIQTCELIGFCQISMFEVAQLEKNSAAYWFDVVNCYDVDQVIGYLKVQIDGIQAMRRMALKILAPKSYDIIQ